MTGQFLGEGIICRVVVELLELVRLLLGTKQLIGSCLVGPSRLLDETCDWICER